MTGLPHLKDVSFLGGEVVDLEAVVLLAEEDATVQLEGIL